ncbi:MAG: 16S rRNA (uracil(1498)-N(3))-methyltransferase [Clostridiales bacterium]|nr:16S rRNA (uracil(1498)-N(3))-methyltransferase [Clostridiales bacterium]
MPRFYIDPPAGDFVTLTGEDARHICRSLRMAVGEALTLCDGAGIDYNGVLRQTDGQIATVEILSRQPSQTEPTVSIRLFQALPKGDKMEWIIQKAVELGVSAVFPLFTSRCVSRPDSKTQPKKVERWGKIAAEAAKQSGRGCIPQVKDFCSFGDAVQMLEDGELGVLFYEKGGNPLSHFLSSVPTKLALFIGPEGGWESEEIEQARTAGRQIAPRGSRILRTETAPLCALSAVMYACGELK